MSSTLEVPSSKVPLPTLTPQAVPRTRPLSTRILHLLRRGHLYLGLALFPWAILYGFTAFIFNHPAVLSDLPVTYFTRADLVGTPLENPPSARDQAAALVAAINEKQKPLVPYVLGAGEVRHVNRDWIVGSVKVGPRSISVLYDPRTASGMMRETAPTKPAAEQAPFSTGPGEGAPTRGMGMGMAPMKRQTNGITLENNLIDLFKAAVPTLLERKRLPTGEVTVTMVPDLKFPVAAGDQAWTATYNPLTTVVSGVAGKDQSDLTFRNFLLRMHLARGYPGEINTKWFWAVGVDAMAIVLCFWGLSGLLMWWQIKSTRKLGFAVLTLSAIAATSLGIAMHGVLS